MEVAINILYIVTKLDTSDKAEDVISHTKFLTLNGHKVVVVSGKTNRVRKIDEVGARHYPMDLKGNIFSVLRGIFILSEIISKENIQIVHAVDGVSSCTAFFAARRNERVFVSTIYEEGKKNIFDRTRLWAKRIIVFSESETRRFAKGGVFLQDKVRLIPEAIDWVSGGKGSAGNIVPGKEPPAFTMVVSLALFSQETAQNFVKAISIFTRHASRIKVFVIARAHTYLRDAEEKLKLLIKRHSLSGIIAISPQDEEKELIAKADLFVQLNPVFGDGVTVDEGVFARPILEAAFFGTPILVEDAGWIRDYVEYGKTALVCPPDNAETMASKMMDLYKNKALRAELANAARDFVREKFDIKKIMGAILRLYEEASTSRNILVIKIGALGDVILAIPSIRAIREKFPTAKIKLLTDVDKREIFLECPFINEVMVSDFKGRDKGLGRLLSIASKLRYEDFDIVIDLQNNKKSHLLSFLSCAPRRYGYDNGKLSFLLNRKIKDMETPLDPVSHQSKVLGLLGIHNVDRKLEIWYSKEDSEWADSFLGSHWVKDNTKLIAFSIGSSKRWITKLWPAEYFADVANTLAKDLGVRIVLIGMGDKDQRIETFLKQARCKPIDALGKTSIPKLAALLKRCDVLLSSDSAPLHVGASVGTPFVALFGPTDPRRHLLPAENSIVLKKDYRCSPCYHTHCHRDQRCMKAIKPDEVVEAIVKLLTTPSLQGCKTLRDGSL